MITRKNMIWMIALLSTSWLTWQTYQQDAEVVVVEPLLPKMAPESYRGAVIGSHSAKAMTGGLDIKLRVKATEPYFNLFSVPVKKVEKLAIEFEKAPTPTAPELPFKYLGAVTEMNQIKVILDNHGEVLVANVGDSLGVNYKLISINKAANATELLFLFLPMNITQTMVVRDVSEH